MKIITLMATTALTVSAALASAPASKFTGFYAGVQTGAVMSNAKTSANGTATTPAVAATPTVAAVAATSTPVNFSKGKRSTGFLFGIYGGYGRQINNFYVGGELSIAADSGKRAVTIKDEAGNVVSTTQYKRGIAFGIAPRLGYVFGDNLVYFKPGIEISKDKFTDKPNGEPTETIASKTNIAFTPALGYERAMGQALLRFEIGYNTGGKISKNITDTDTNTNVKVQQSYSDTRLTVGVAYKF